MNEGRLITLLLLAPAMLPIRTLEIRRVAPMVLIFLSVSLVILLVSPTSAYAEATKAPDLTDYTSMYKDIFENILDNEKSIKEYKKELDDKSKLPDEISAIKKKIAAQKLENQGLWENLNEIERLNIESYKLDKKTQRLFDEAENVIKDSFLGVNGVYDVFTERKYRKVIVSIDPDNFANSDYPHGINAFIDEIQKSVDVDVEVQVAKLIQINSMDSDQSLYKQIQSGIENKYLKCSNPDHQLVTRQSLQISCVTGESALKSGWAKVKFSENNDWIVSYTPLEIEADGEKFQINATLKNGLIQKAWRDGPDILSLKINSIKEGEAKLEFPAPFFMLPEGRVGYEIIVLENLEVMHIYPWPGQYRHVVEFPFSDTDPEIEVILMYLT